MVDYFELHTVGVGRKHRVVSTAVGRTLVLGRRIENDAPCVKHLLVHAVYGLSALGMKRHVMRAWRVAVVGPVVLPLFRWPQVDAEERTVGVADEPGGALRLVARPAGLGTRKSREADRFE